MCDTEVDGAHGPRRLLIKKKMVMMMGFDPKICYLYSTVHTKLTDVQFLPGSKGLSSST